MVLNTGSTIRNGVEKVGSRNITEVEFQVNELRSMRKRVCAKMILMWLASVVRLRKESGRRVGRWGNGAFNPCYLTNWLMTRSGFITLPGFNQGNKS